MAMVKLIAATVTLLSMTSVSAAQVSDLAESDLGGRFREEATGAVWLDVSNFYNRSFLDISSELIGTGFRIARSEEVERLIDALNGPDAAMGQATSCEVSRIASFACFIGVYNDLNDNPRAGLAFERNDTADGVFADFNAPDQMEETNGAWVIQQTAPSCDNDQELDFDCDGIDDKVVWREGNGTWFIRLSATSEVIVQQWGLPGDIPIAGDFDGDGVPDLAVWRPTNGTWYIKNSSTQYSAPSATVQQFGLPGDVPMRLDTDGDGRLDLVVWRPSQGNFYTLQSSDSLVLVEQFGLPGDIPVTAGRTGG